MPLFLGFARILSWLIDGSAPMDHPQGGEHTIVIVDSFNPEASATVPLRLRIDCILVQLKDYTMRCIAHLVDFLPSSFEKFPGPLFRLSGGPERFSGSIPVARRVAMIVIQCRPHYRPSLYAGQTIMEHFLQFFAGVGKRALIAFEIAGQQLR